LPVVRIGRATRIPAAALERWVEERTAPTRTAPDGSRWQRRGRA
jgi:hypothetical protein